MNRWLKDENKASKVRLAAYQVTVSTLNPIVGIVVTTSPTCNRYKIVVLPAPGNVKEDNWSHVTPKARAERSLQTIETEDKDSDLLVAPEPVQQLGKEA